MKVLLIDPPGTNKGLNLGLAYLAAALIADGRDEVFVLDLNNRTHGRLGDHNPHVPSTVWLPELERTLHSFLPDVIGISVKTFTSVVAGEVISVVRRTRPSATVVLGGPHVTLDSVHFLQETGADIGVVGQGVLTFPEVCRALEQGRSLSEIDGIVYRSENVVVANKARPRLKDLDSLLLPNYSVFSSVQRDPTLLHEYPLFTSEGCPFSCTYCAIPLVNGKRWRARSPMSVISELRMAVQQYHSTSFIVVDNNFTLNTRRAEDICAGLIENVLSMPWRIYNGLRADRMTPTLAERMYQSGCYHVWVGIESADDEIFQSINKGEKLEDIKAGVATLKAAGIKVGGFFMIGLPGSSREKDLKSLALARELGIEAWWFNCVPYPFTKAADWVRQNATILRHSEGAAQYGGIGTEPVFETPNYSRSERIATFEELNLRIGYIDRLVNPHASWPTNVAYLVRTVPKYGIRPTLSMIRYIAASIYRRGAWGGWGEQSTAIDVAVTVPKATSQNLDPKPIRPLEAK